MVTRTRTATPVTRKTSARKTPVRAKATGPVAAPAPKAATRPLAAAADKPLSAKAGKTPKPPRADKPAKAAKVTDKAKKPKLVRDSFTIPKSEYEVIAALKLRAARLGQTPKKSELLRAGIKLLAGLGDQPLLDSLAAVPSIKTGRPAA